MDFTPVKNMLATLRTAVLPLIVWFAAVVGIVILFAHRAQPFQVTGLAISKTYEVSTHTTGTIKNLSAQQFQPVKKGAVIAILDDTLIRERLATAKSEIDRLYAEIDVVKNRINVENHNRKSETAIDFRRFTADIERSRLQILELNAIIEPDLILLKDLNAEINIEKELIEKHAVSTDYALTRAQARYDALQKKIQQNRHLLEEAKLTLAATEKRRQDIADSLPVGFSPDAEIEVIHKAITVQQHRVKEILAESESLTVIAPVDGIVTNIQLRAGQTALPGLTILTIAEQTSDQIIAYAGSEYTASLKEGMPVELILETPIPTIGRSQITYVGPTVQELPIRLRQQPDIAQWGRPFIIKIPPQIKLVPGQAIGIRGL